MPSPAAPFGGTVAVEGTTAGATPCAVGPNRSRRDRDLRGGTITDLSHAISVPGLYRAKVVVYGGGTIGQEGLELR